MSVCVYIRHEQLDVPLPGKLVDGIAKGHPASDEIRKAVEFYRGLAS